MILIVVCIDDINCVGKTRLDGTLERFRVPESYVSVTVLDGMPV
jgi:hypothetical protein